MRRQAVLAGIAVMAGLCPLQASAAGTMNDCFADLERGKGTHIVCNFPLKPSETERAELEKQTAGFMKNVTCTVAISVERALVTSAVNTPDYEFQAPPQPVTCNVTMPGKAAKGANAATPDTVIPITGNFAPKVSIKSGIAVQATPGLADVKGVPRILSIPAVAYVNRAHFLRDGMLKIVNAWMAHMRNPKSAKAQ